MPLLKEGDNIKDTYEVERFLGEGAFAEVYRVKHKFLGRQAMKLFKRVGMTQGEIEEMLGEAILLSRIGHPNIVRVFDANIFESPKGTCGYFTMENVSGGSLDKFWRSYGSNFIPIETTVDIMLQVCRGLAVAHDESPPVIHRDIKPQNILIGYEADGLRARVSDFGLAKKVNPLTLMATAAGTLAFKAPEAFLKKKADSCVGDVWALGVTLYMMLTDKLPFEVDSDLGWSNKKAFEKELVPPSFWNIEADPAIEKIVLNCLEINSSKRYQTARDLLDTLKSWKKPAPSKKSPPLKSASLGESKSGFGAHSPIDQETGNKLANLAIKKAKEEGRLFEAADIMEEAFNKSPSLREKYANQVRLWRCGISM